VLPGHTKEVRTQDFRVINVRHTWGSLFVRQ